MKKIVTIGLAVTMLFALTASGPASAHQRTERTRISIRPKAKTIDAGQKVMFRGRLKSDWTKCFRFRTVSLYKEGQLILSKKTTRTGRYSFTRRPRNTHTWFVVFAGRSWGNHPHVHRCLASRSRGSVITVR
jgi:hypothetical protein